MRVAAAFFCACVADAFFCAATAFHFASPPPLFTARQTPPSPAKVNYFLLCRQRILVVPPPPSLVSPPPLPTARQTAVPRQVNYDLPVSSKDYVHRVGRTARAGRSGRTIAMVVSRRAVSVPPYLCRRPPAHAPEGSSSRARMHRLWPARMHCWASQWLRYANSPRTHTHTHTHATTSDDDNTLGLKTHRPTPPQSPHGEQPLRSAAPNESCCGLPFEI